jgi:hypothetical protein
MSLENGEIALILIAVLLVWYTLHQIRGFLTGAVSPALLQSGSVPADGLAVPLSTRPSFDRERADRLYRKYGPLVYRQCLRLLRDSDAAREATQTVFIGLLRDVDLLKDPETALRLSYQAATSHCSRLACDGLLPSGDRLDLELR